MPFLIACISSPDFGSVNNTNIAGTINGTAIGNHTDPFSTANLKFNGVNRFSSRPPSYFKKYQPLIYRNCLKAISKSKSKHKICHLNTYL